MYLLFKQICVQGAVLHKSTVVKLFWVQTSNRRWSLFRCCRVILTTTSSTCRSLKWQLLIDRTHSIINLETGKQFGNKYKPWDRAESEETHRSLGMQLVRVPRLLECLILRAEATGCGLQDSLGSSGAPEESLFTAYLISGSWGGSRKICSEESHCLWKNQNKNRMWQRL